MRTLDTVIPELLSRGLLSRADVVHTGVEATDLSRRNLNFCVRTLDRTRGVVVKAPDDAAHTRGFVDREARFYRFCTEHGVLLDARPRLLEVDDATGALFMRWIPHTHSLHELYASEAPDDLAALGAEVGRGLVAIRAASDACASLLAELPTRLPSILSIHRPSPSAYAQMSRANLELLRILQRETATCAILDQLRAAWTADGLTHGDVKGGNLVVTDASPRRVVFVDWESVQRGDAAWDVAGALHDVLIAWLASMPVRDEAPESYVAKAKLPLARVHPFTRALWREYRASFAAPAREAGPFLARTVGFVGARLLQAAYEEAGQGAQLTTHVVAMLQLGTNVLAQPADACATLLGLVPEWTAPPAMT